MNCGPQSDRTEKWKSVEFPDLLQVESCRAQCSHCSMGGYEMATLTGQINHHHNSITTMQFREFANEVDADSVPVIFRDWQWMQFTHWLVTLCLCLKAEIASLAVFTYELQHVGPPVIPQNEFKGLPTSHRACYL